MDSFRSAGSSGTCSIPSSVTLDATLVSSLSATILLVETTNAAYLLFKYSSPPAGFVPAEGGSIFVWGSVEILGAVILFRRVLQAPASPDPPPARRPSDITRQPSSYLS